MAKDCNRRVEVAQLRSETAQVFANPSGTTTAELSAVPVRARAKSGAWGAIDTSLRAAPDGSLAPVLSVADVRFSAGGTGPLATMATSQGTTVSLTWPSALPVPRVEGDTAVYENVLPEVDLRVRALRDGFSHVLVVKSRKAAENPAVRQVRYGLAGAGFGVKPGAAGGLDLVDGVGQTVMRASEPLMWDSRQASTSVKHAAASTPQDRLGGVEGTSSTAQAAGEGARTASLPMTHVDGRLRLEPDVAMLTDPGTQYPVYVDPAWTTINASRWAWANNANKNNNDEARIGKNPDGGEIYRSFFEFPMGGLHGSSVLSATLYSTVVHSWSCGPTPLYLYQSGVVGGSGKIGWSPPLQALLGQVSVNAHKGSSACGNQPDKPVEFGVTGAVQNAVNSGWGTLTMGFSAASNTGGAGEGTEDRWKKLKPEDTKLSVQFNRVPNVPDSLSVDGKGCAAGAGRPFVSTASPTLRARATDPDNDSMTVWLAIARWNQAQNNWVDMVSGAQYSVPSGGVAQWTPTGLVDNGIYVYRAQSTDTNGAVGPVTHIPGNCEFQVDLIDPVVPTVMSDVYKQDSAGCPKDGCGSVGQTGSFTFASSPDVVSYKWGFTDPPTTLAAAPSLGAPVTVTWTPPAGGAQTLSVQAVDRAGRTATKTYQFYVAGPTPAVANHKLNDPAGSTTLADASGHGNGGSLKGTGLGAPGRIVGGDTALLLDRAATSDGKPASFGWSKKDLLDTSTTFTVAVWAKLADKSKPQFAISSDGAARSALSLSYEPGTDRWTFRTHKADDAASPGWQIQSDAPATLNVWTHLVATYDASDGAMRLYINGVKQAATVTGAEPWRASTVHFGAWYAGSLSDVRLWNRAITDNEAAAYSDPRQVGNVGEWHMGEVGKGPAFDASGMNHDLTFYPDATISTGGSGKVGTGLNLDGKTGYAQTAGPVVYTDQAYTVSAWVRLTDTTTRRSVISQEGTQDSAFDLYYDKDANRWAFAVSASDTAAPATVRVLSTGAPQPSVWTRLTAVYDAAVGKIRLYANDRPQGEAAAPATWHAAKALNIGRALHGGSATSFWAGDIDEVQVYAGVLDPAPPGCASSSSSAGAFAFRPC